MARNVYDDESKTPKSLTPEEVRGLEDKSGSNVNDESANSPNSNLGGLNEKKDRLNQGHNDERQNTKATEPTPHEGQLGNGYSPGSGKTEKKPYWQRLAKRRGLLAGSGLLGGGLIVGILLFFSFLNVFKLDHMMSNIDQKTFSRFNAAANGRSDKWVQSYLFLRLMQLQGNGTDSDSEYFRANKVDTNNPIKDWYHTLRTSNFEADLAKKGIVFTNKSAGNGFTFSVLEVNGKQIAGLTPSDVRSGNLVDRLRNDPTFVESKLAEVDLTKPGANKDARALIKQTVNGNARFSSVLKRRQVRKDIQNMTGVKDWTFFETTRDKVNNKAFDIRDKIVIKAIPESTLSGKFIKCLFGISDCRFSEDPSDPQYRSDSSLTTHADGTPDSVYDKNGKPVGSFDLSDAADVTKQIISKAGGALSVLNIVNTLDSLTKVDTAIHNHDLSKGVAVARGVQAMGLYQVFETSRDQIKTGQLTSDEVNKLMQVIGPIASSESWTKVIDGHGGSSSKMSKEEYCSTKNQAAIENNPDLGNKQFAYLCPDKQIGGSSNAAALENAYNSSIGPILSPILAAYNAARNIPVIGAVVSFMEGIVNSISGVFTSALQSILDLAGIGKNVQDAMTWVVNKVAAFLGAGPILNGKESAGVFANWTLQGGAYTAEASTRANGGALTTASSKASAESSTASYYNAQSAQMSSFDKYLSLSNPQSPAARSTFALTQTNTQSLVGKLTDFGSTFKAIGSTMATLFGHRAFAASDTGYEGAQFAGIQTFDIPQQCYDRNPVDPSYTAIGGTNALQIFQKYGITVSQDDLTKLQSWETENSSDDFYSTIYGIIGDRQDADTIAEQIYDCNLIDTSVRGGIGYVYGYTNDNGLEDSSSSAGNSSSSNGGNTSVSGDWAWPTKVQGAVITSCFGSRHGAAGGGYHPGTDISQAEGTPVYAAQAGKVTFEGPVSGYGNNYVAIEVSPTVNEGYGHMDSATVHQGDQVTAGQQIGTIGSQGFSTGPHLHFNLRIGPNTDPYNGNASPFNHGLTIPSSVTDSYNCATYHYPGAP
jgi:murein DD-endopeptidase MepM/ murein hydrolase activator NlpD